MKTSQLKKTCVTAAAVLLLTNLAAAQDRLVVGKAAAVAPDFDSGSQRWPDVAWGGDNYLVVWQEGAAYDGAPDANIMAARISPEGRPLDPQGIVVCKAKHHQIYPKVTFDGTNFLVAWQDYRSERDWDVMAARVSPEGRLLDPDGIALADGPGNQVHPSLACDGRRVLAVWSDLRPNPGGAERYVLAGTFVSDGRPQPRNGKVLGENGKTGTLLGSIVRWDGESFLVAAQRHPSSWDHGQSWLVRVRPDGKTERVRFDFFGPSYALATDAAGKRSLIWSYNQVGHGSYNCVFQIGVLPSAKRQLVLGLPPKFSPANELWAAAVHDGKSFLVVTERGTDLKNNQHGSIEIDLIATRVDAATGKPLDTGATDYAGDDVRKYLTKNADAFGKEPGGIEVAAEPNVFERHPALATSGDGKSLVVYSRHAGPARFVLRFRVLTR